MLVAFSCGLIYYVLDGLFWVLGLGYFGIWWLVWHMCGFGFGFVWLMVCNCVSLCTCLLVG